MHAVIINIYVYLCVLKRFYVIKCLRPEKFKASETQKAINYFYDRNSYARKKIIIMRYEGRRAIFEAVMLFLEFIIRHNPSCTADTRKRLDSKLNCVGYSMTTMDFFF